MPASAALPMARWDGTKLAMVEMGLTTLDPVPKEQQQANLLYISRNNLTTLDGIQQFAQLRVVSAGDNLMGSTAALAPFRHCPWIEVVTLEGNPLCSMPNYRVGVFCSVPATCWRHAQHRTRWGFNGSTIALKAPGGMSV